MQKTEYPASEKQGTEYPASEKQETNNPESKIKESEDVGATAPALKDVGATAPALKDVGATALAPKVELVIKVIPEITQDWNYSRIAREAPPPTWEAVFVDALDELGDIDKLFEQEKRNTLEVGNLAIVPLKRNTFRAFEVVPFNAVKVIIIGQDPYFDIIINPLGKPVPRATGMAFSVYSWDVIPSSLSNVYKEIASCDKNFKIPSHGDLTGWANQGVLLINSALTTISHTPKAHGKRWFGFLHKIINAVVESNPKVVFLLLGAQAQDLAHVINDRAKIVTAVHPSGQSAHRGFFGSQCFLRVNKALAANALSPIDWGAL